MTAAIHGSFTVERVFDASPSRVFRAFADPVAKARWFVGPAGWSEIERSMDFRAGGREIAHGRFSDGTETRFESRYHAIVDGERLVYVYDMYVGGALLSVSLATIELTRQGTGTLLRITEQGVYFDAEDANDQRREGTLHLLEQIATHLPD